MFDGFVFIKHALGGGEAMEAQQIVGTFRRFGHVGPVYEIVRHLRDHDNGDQVMLVRVVETGEEVEYKFLDILDDPREI